MTIYIDVIIIENLIMNYIILSATAIITKTKIKYIRIFIASLIGAIYSITEYISNLKIYSNVLLKAMLSIIIVYVAYNPQNTKKMWKQLILFYLTSFTFAGVATYLIYVIKPQEVLNKNGVYTGINMLKIIFLGGLLGAVVIIIAFKISKHKLNKKDMILDIKLKINEKELELKTMIDTGNMLKEPISGKSVIVVEHTKLYNIIPYEILDNLQQIIGGDLEKIPDKIKNDYVSKLKIIPFSSLGKQNGMLIGIKAILVEIKNEDIIEEKNNEIIVGIYDKSLTKRGEYSALVGIECFDTNF